MAAFGQGTGWPLELAYLAEFLALKQIGFVDTFQEFLGLPALVREDMRLAAEVKASAAAQ